MKQTFLFRAKLLVIAGVLALNLGILIQPATVSAQSFPGINGRIIYTDHDGDYDIFSAKADGSDIQNLTNSDSNTQDYAAYSANGTKITYTSWVSGTPQILIMNADGSGKTVLTSGSTNLYSSFSPDGTKIVFASNRDASNYEIYTMNIDGSNVTRLTTLSDAAIEPEYSPDGTKILFQSDNMSDTDIFTMNTDGSNVTDVSSNTNREATPHWSPDGTKIICAKHDGTNFRISVRDANGSNQAYLTSNSVINLDPVYSPDGNYIIYRDGTNEDIRKMDDDGSNNTMLVNGTFVGYPSWQPLTLGPTTIDSTPTITVSGGTATLNIPSLYTDPYGTGIASSTVAVTGAPTKGTTSVNSSTGVITYTQVATVSKRSILNNIASIFFAKASAATIDSFNYTVCSSTNTSLCSTGTTTVVLAANTVVGTGQGAGISIIFALGIIGTVIWLQRRRITNSR